MIRFIHTADTHFGVENYGKIDQKTGIHSRLLDFHQSLNSCIDAAINHDVDFFLFCGDAYKTTTPSPTQQRLFFSCLLRLFQAHIPVVMIIGNHDNPLSFGKTHTLDLFDQLPLAGFHVIAQPKTLVLETKSGPISIVGIPWPTRTTLALNKNAMAFQARNLNEYISSALARIIAHQAENLNPQLPAVLAGHLTVSNGLFSGSEKCAIYGQDPLLLPSHLAIAPFDYVALGHLHRYQNLNPHGHPAVVYSGSIDRVDFGERNETKGFSLVTIHDKTNTEHSFVPLATRPFVQVEVHFEPEKNQTEQIIAALKQKNITHAIVKIVYHVPVGQKDRVEVKTIQAFCADAQHLIGIFPIHEKPPRTVRSNVNVDMDLDTILTHYFKAKNLSPESIKRLLEKTHKLEPDQ